MIKLAVIFSLGMEAFAYLHQVATHPRCTNCHGAMRGGQHVPLVGEDSHPHPMNVQERITSLGLRCTSCHQDKNLDDPGAPPGASNTEMPNFLWQMPPEKMILGLDLKPKELCEQWLDPQRNGKEAGGRGGKDDLPKFRREFLEHLQKDPLIHWAFEPGVGRKPAPGSKEKLVESAEAWIKWLEAGNGCDDL